jgi:heterotetrameric sarcosine oxidase gamma subunit
MIQRLPKLSADLPEVHKPTGTERLATAEELAEIGGGPSDPAEEAQILALLEVQLKEDLQQAAVESAARPRGDGAAVTDLSSGFTVLRLVGPATRRLLEEACPVDLGTDTVADLQIVQATLANVHVILARQDQGSRPGFTILVARAEAEYLWDSLVGLGEAHGLVPIGGAAAGSPS